MGQTVIYLDATEKASCRLSPVYCDIFNLRRTLADITPHIGDETPIFHWMTQEDANEIVFLPISCTVLSGPLTDVLSVVRNRRGRDYLVLLMAG